MLRLGGRGDTQASEALGWLAGAAALAPRLWTTQALGFVADYALHRLWSAGRRKLLLVVENKQLAAQ